MNLKRNGEETEKIEDLTTTTREKKRQKSNNMKIKMSSASSRQPENGMIDPKKNQSTFETERENQIFMVNERISAHAFAIVYVFM